MDLGATFEQVAGIDAGSADRAALARWYAQRVPASGPFSVEASVLRAIEVPQPDPDLPPAPSEGPLDWLPAALHAVAVTRGRFVADLLVRSLRRAGPASVERYGFAWRSASVEDRGPVFELQPVIAAAATSGLGAAGARGDTLALWQLVQRRRDRLGLGEAAARAQGFTLVPPTRPLAAFTLRTAPGARLDALVRLRETAHRAVEQLLRFHTGALAGLPGALDPHGRGVPVPEGEAPSLVEADEDAAPAGAITGGERRDAWDAMFEQWLRWRADHPRRRPPEDSELAHWLRAQRGAARSGRLGPQRVEMLEESGVPLFEAPVKRDATVGASSWVPPGRADLPS